MKYNDIVIHDLLRKRNFICLGDVLHNQKIKLLFKDINLNNIYAKEIIKILNKMLVKYEKDKDWLDDILSWKYCKDINLIMKSKDSKTFINRLNLFLHETLLTSSRKYLITNDLIYNINRLIDKYEK